MKRSEKDVNLQVKDKVQVKEINSDLFKNSAST